MTVSLIVAAAENNVIGKDGAMPWHIPEDLKRFKTLTMGKPCVMGRKTFESILTQLGKPLPGRTSIVVSRSGFIYESATTCPSLESALEKAKETADEIMIIGGAQIYEQALPLAQRIYLTRIHQTPDGDALFPEIDKEAWKETARENFETHSFLTFEKA